MLFSPHQIRNSCLDLFCVSHFSGSFRHQENLLDRCEDRHAPGKLWARGVEEHKERLARGVTTGL